MKKIFTFCVVVAIAGLFTETSSFATPVKPVVVLIPVMGIALVGQCRISLVVKL